MALKGSLNEGASYFEFLLRAAFLSFHVELVSLLCNECWITTNTFTLGLSKGDFSKVHEV
jgi:hypothetical protein